MIASSRTYRESDEPGYIHQDACASLYDLEAPELLEETRLIAVGDKVLRDLTILDNIPTAEEYLVARYGDRRPDIFHHGVSRLLEILNTYEVFQKASDRLRQEIKQLCERQRQAEFDSDEYQAITEEIAQIRASSREAESMCDEYDDHLR
jgi:hypothetical protein